MELMNHLLESNSQLASVCGNVFSIQHYCIHDGPGIRTNVFLKGCPLRCLWCANPESQNPQPEHLYRNTLCVGCAACIPACPQNAISMGPHGKVNVDFSRCNNCGICAEKCAPTAHTIAGERMTALEAFRQVNADALFYGTEGGITITGGEPMLQPDFVYALLTLSREAGFTTAMETCGFAPWQTVSRLAKLTDTFLYDLKCMDPRLHNRYTGQDNAITLSNLQKLSDECESVIIVRAPIICGCNDSEENIHAMGQFVHDKVKRCHEIHLLPYHNLGECKYEQLGYGEQPCRFEVPTEARMEMLRAILRAYVETVK